MVSSQVCQFYKYGYCRFLDICRHEHVHEVCADSQCDNSSCHKRHPRNCIYFEKYNRCKFGSYCQYNHDINRDNGSTQSQEEILLLRSRIENLEESIADLIHENDNLKTKLEKIESEVAGLRMDKVNSDEASTDIQGGMDDQSDVASKELEEMKMLNSRRNALGLDFASYPAWSFKTP